MVDPKMAPLGTTIRRLSGVSNWVVNRSISTTFPVTPATETTSPTLKGRKISSIAPAEKLPRVPCSARPMAKPAAARIAAKLATEIPNTLSTASPPRTSTP
ncbi:MAG: hypothetical protein GWM90_02935 [Gemmatimonadetes bacterium]|nr:hypothetical protein [Gemmatimonadota bacterium]NIQ52572.1 hypothetical protein [Gemmatimonadota bacterium]NIX43116.1 hypothetical protein [Gemmatimonadota bacterium]NIY07278.1 hypothetical protein [Gemmatimonadota bacterium]